MAAEEKSSSFHKSMLRAKVYRLNDDGKWDDEGTGHVTFDSLEGSQEPGLSVIDEEYNNTLLLHQISLDDIYHKEEDTIISWREPVYGTDLALSFQKTMGCSYIWERIQVIRALMGVVGRRADQSPPEIMAQVNVVNGGNVVSGKLDEASGSRKQANEIRTLGTEYGISREVLEQHSGKKLEDVAALLGVSRSTLKRICRKHRIFRWPPSKGKGHNYQEFVQATARSIEESSQRTRPVSELPLEKDSVSEMRSTPEPGAKALQDDSSIMVKATFKDDIIKFQLSLASRKLDLEKAITMRLNLSVGNFKIKYLDEEGDWVLIACDADLRTCLTALGKATIKMLIDPITL